MMIEYLYDAVFLYKLGINPFRRCEQLDNLDKDSLERIIKGIHSNAIKKYCSIILARKFVK